LRGQSRAIFRGSNEIWRHAHVAATISDCEISMRVLSNWRY
jgi:hypothetical protein